MPETKWINCAVAPEGIEIPRDVPLEVGSTAVYNHALSALTLSEVYSMGGADTEKHKKAIERAIEATLKMQAWPKPLKADKGGWRYVTRRDDKPDSDLSVTGWQVMFLRSAKNAGFDVPQEPIDDAVAYALRCFQKQHGTFTMLSNNEDRRSRGMAVPGYWPWPTQGCITPMKRDSRENGCFVKDSRTTTNSDSTLVAGTPMTGTTTAFSVPARPCTNLVAIRGDSSSLLWQKSY